MRVVDRNINIRHGLTEMFTTFRIKISYIILSRNIDTFSLIAEIVVMSRLFSISSFSF